MHRRPETGRFLLLRRIGRVGQVAHGSRAGDGSLHRRHPMLNHAERRVKILTQNRGLTHARTRTHTRAHARTRMHARTHTHAHACTHTRAHTHAGTHTHGRTHTRAHTHARKIHTHTPTTTVFHLFSWPKWFESRHTSNQSQWPLHTLTSTIIYTTTLYTHTGLALTRLDQPADFRNAFQSRALVQILCYTYTHIDCSYGSSL